MPTPDRATTLILLALKKRFPQLASASPDPDSIDPSALIGWYRELSCAEDPEPDRADFIERARGVIGPTVDIEFDEDAELSRGDDLTWVQAWVAVHHESEESSA